MTGGNIALANATPEIGAIKKGYLRWNEVAPSIFDWSYAGTTPPRPPTAPTWPIS